MRKEEREVYETRRTMFIFHPDETTSDLKKNLAVGGFDASEVSRRRDVAQKFSNSETESDWSALEAHAAAVIWEPSDERPWPGFFGRDPEIKKPGFTAHEREMRC